MTPAALSILMTTFREGAERNTALGVWGAVGASGGTVGVLLGGVLTDTIGWEWIFFLNVPVALAVIAVAPALLNESRADVGHRRFDLAGALSVTAGIALLVYALVEADSAGWASAQTLGLIGASAALLALFATIELRSRAPVMPFSIFRIRAVTGSNVASLALGGAVFGMIFILTLYMQQVLAYSPIETGLAWLAMSLTALASSIVASGLVTRVGTRLPLAVGLVVAGAGLLLLSQIPADGDYVADLLPGLLVTGLGLGTSFVSLSIGALEGVAERDAGLASGLVNTTQQVGGALGVAVLSTLAISRSDDLVADGTAAPVALTEGFQIALIAAAGFAIVGALAVLALVRGRRQAEPVAEPVAEEPAARARGHAQRRLTPRRRPGACAGVAGGGVRVSPTGPGPGCCPRCLEPRRLRRAQGGDAVDRLQARHVVLLEGDALAAELLHHRLDIGDLEAGGGGLVGPGELARIDEEHGPVAAGEHQGSLEVLNERQAERPLVEGLGPLDVGGGQPGTHRCVGQDAHASSSTPTRSCPGAWRSSPARPG